jgi:predicted Zn-ribbon and HTH transcriptional regulator
MIIMEGRVLNNSEPVKAPDVITSKHCEHCGYSWYPRSPNRPVQCPRCKKMDWDIPNIVTEDPKEIPGLLDDVPEK